MIIHYFLMVLTNQIQLKRKLKLMPMCALTTHNDDDNKKSQIIYSLTEVVSDWYDFDDSNQDLFMDIFRNSKIYQYGQHKNEACDASTMIIKFKILKLQEFGDIQGSVKK